MNANRLLFVFSLIAAAIIQILDPHAQAADANQTRELITVLESGAPLFERARACQQLGEIGTAKAVPALAGLLSDPKLSAYARSGLENIPGPEATAALRDAARRIRGPLLVGIVNSLGKLHDKDAVGLLTRLAAGPNAGAAGEALLALGNITTPEAVDFLEQALGSGAEAIRPAAAAACLLAADGLRVGGDTKRALALYDRVRAAQVPLACRVGATRGAILAHQVDRVPFLIDLLRSGEPPIRNAALLTIRDVSDEQLAAALNTELGRTAEPDFQQQLLLAVADCHNAQSIAVIQPLADSSNAAVRKTALTALGKFGPGAALALVSALEKQRPEEERSIILNRLKVMEGSAVDQLVLQHLTLSDVPASQADLIELLENRRSAMAAPAIVKHVSAADKRVQLAALSALKSLGTSAELPALVAVTKSTSDDAVRDSAEDALAGICSRSGDAAAESILHELANSNKPLERNCWIRVLARSGSPKALPVLEAAARDSNAEVADNALAQLGHWPDPAPMNTLLESAHSGSDARLRQRALNSVLDLAAAAADDAQVPQRTIGTWMESAHPFVQSTSDKLRFISVLGRLKTTQSVHLLAAYVDDADVRNEAASAIVQIAPSLPKGEDTTELKSALARIASAAPTPELGEKASALAKTIPAVGPPVSLFDGHSLAGWEGDTKVWRVRDGVILGGSLQGNPQNEFLATTRSYTNFVLRLEYKLVGTEGFVNSGVQIRSVRVRQPPNEMSGYQADIGAGASGCLYDESRRNKYLARPSPETVQRLEKAADWNHYEIRCDGRNIQLWLNGEKTVDYTEADQAIPQQGLIGLQIHGGNKAEVSFRNITIQEF
jgi:HEAT repeat protein